MKYTLAKVSLLSPEPKTTKEGFRKLKKHQI